MKEWYCHIGGQQYGPASEQDFHAWIREGRIGPRDPVWTEGMAQWAPAGQVLPELFAPGCAGAAPSSMVPAAATSGSGGQTPNPDLRRQARELLRGRWGEAMLFSLLYGLLTFAIQVLPSVGGVIMLILGGPFALGATIFYLTFIRRGPTRLGMMFDGFRNFGNALGAYLLTGVLVLLWMLLLIVPGIIAALAYSQAMYLIADDRTLGPMQAIRKSKEMMQGHKWRLFCMGLSFLGWELLCMLTLGIGFLWLVPYMSAAYARFYDDLRAPAGTAPQVPPA